MASGNGPVEKPHQPEMLPSLKVSLGPIFYAHGRSRVSPASRMFDLFKLTRVATQHRDCHVQDTGGAQTRLLLPNKGGDKVRFRSLQEVIGNRFCRYNVGGRLAVDPNATSTRPVFENALENGLLERSEGLHDKRGDLAFGCHLGNLKDITAGGRENVPGIKHDSWLRRWRIYRNDWS